MKVLLRRNIKAFLIKELQLLEIGQDVGVYL